MSHVNSTDIVTISLRDQLIGGTLALLAESKTKTDDATARAVLMANVRRCVRSNVDPGLTEGKFAEQMALCNARSRAFRFLL